MTTNPPGAAPSPIALSPKVRRLVVADSLDRPPIGRLTAEHVEALTAVATRRGTFEVPVVAARAIRALALGASATAAVPVLAQVLDDTDGPRTDRVTAARGLADVATPEAQAVLMRRVRDRDPRVQQAVFAALGRFAGPDALRDLVRVVDPGDLAARRQLVFAEALIAHRAGLTGGPFLREVEGVPRQPDSSRRMIELTLGTKTRRASTADRAKLTGPTYGIELGDRAFELKAGRAEWTVFVNGGLGATPAALAGMFDRPWIVALLGRWERQRARATSQYVVLTRPVADGVRIDVVRGDGEVVYTGSAGRHGGGVLGFSVADVARPGTAPTNVAGRITTKGVELTVTVPFGTRIESRTAERVVPNVAPDRDVR